MYMHVYTYISIYIHKHILANSLSQYRTAISAVLIEGLIIFLFTTTHIYTYTSLSFSRSLSGGRRWQQCSSRVSFFSPSPSRAFAPSLPRLSPKGTCVYVYECTRD